jgi:type III pantothenate kinase
MFICVDLGNTITTIGVLEGTSVKASWRVMTGRRTRDEYRMVIESILLNCPLETSDIAGAGVCSVVPSETDHVIKAISSLLEVPVSLVDGLSDCGIRVVTDNPAEVGGDRIANAVGAFYGYGGPAIVVDMGTATTFDYISEDGEYRGGVIAPGLVAGARDLWERARMLPEVEIKRPSKIIGTDTITCMQSGIYYGAIGQVETIVRRMWKEIGTECKVIITGGRVALMLEDLGIDIEYDPDLTLKGIAHTLQSQ